jgi:hypothetical protein
MHSFRLDWFEFISASLLYTIILLATINFRYYFRKYQLVFDNKTFNVFTILMIITSIVIIYRNQIISLLLDPPPYAIFSAIGLFILTNSISEYQKQLESNKVFTQQQTGLLEKQITHTEKSVNFELDLIRKNELKSIDDRVEKLEGSVEKLEKAVGNLEIEVKKIPDIITQNNITLLKQIKILIQESK